MVDFEICLKMTKIYTEQVLHELVASVFKCFFTWLTVRLLAPVWIRAISISEISAFWNSIRNEFEHIKMRCCGRATTNKNCIIFMEAKTLWILAMVLVFCSICTLSWRLCDA